MGKDYQRTYYVVAALRNQRRIRRIGRGQDKIATYEITDPYSFDLDSPPPERPLRWG